MEPTMQEAKAAVDALNTAFAEFKRTNDARLKEIEAKGAADQLFSAKLDAINADIAKHDAIVQKFAQVETVVNRLAAAGPPAEDAEQRSRVERFNLELRSDATARGSQMPTGVSADEYRAYADNFRLWLRRGPNAVEQRAMSVGSDPDGGYLVTPDVSGRIVKRLYDTSPLRPIVSVQTIGTDKLEGLRDIDEASGGGWVSEIGSRSTTTTPQLGKWQIEIHEQYENPGTTQKLLDDASINVEQWLADKVADKFMRRENTAFVVGTGVGQPRGFASYTTAATADSSRAWGVLEHLDTGSNGSFGTNPNGSDKLIDLTGKLKPHFRQNARWAMNRLTLTEARKLKDAGGASGNTGNYLWQPSLAAGQPSSLLGYPVVELEDMATYSTTAALAVALGDFAMGYQIVDRIGIRTLRDPFTNKPYVQFYTTRRVGGDVIDFEAIKFLRFSA